MKSIEIGIITLAAALTGFAGEFDGYGKMVLEEAVDIGAWANGVHYVDVDNIQIRLAAPKWYLCNTWPVHNLVHADEGRVRFNSSFWGSFFGPEAKPAYACELVTADGKLLGRAVCVADDQVDALFDQVKRELIDMIAADAAWGQQGIDLLMVAKYLERIGDHATNVAEWVEYSITGVHPSNN